MEVHPCLKQYIGESDRPPQSPGSDFMYKEKSNCMEHDINARVHDRKDDEIMTEAQGPQSKEYAEGHNLTDDCTTGSPDGALILDCQLENHNFSSCSRGIQNGGIDKKAAIESCASPVTSGKIPISNNNESSSNNNDEEAIHDSEWLDHDEPLAVWVKCEGNWQAGVRCAKADCPSSVLKARPIHIGKKHFVIFFPRTKKYLWADVSLMRPINELPQPIVHRTHDVAREEVKDVKIAHLFIMQKLAVSMLNIIEQLHSKALVDSARDVIAVKEFATEASCCADLPHLGAMLVKLHDMVLQSFMSSDWLKNTSHSWRQQCLTADTAESVEFLTEELSNAILWKEVDSTSNETIKAHFSADWKNEYLKLFSVYNPVMDSEDHMQQCFDEPWNLNVQVGRKRPKLEIRRGESTSSYPPSQNAQEVISVHESDFVRGEDDVNSVTLESFQEEMVKQENEPQELTATANKWVDIVVQANEADLSHTKDDARAPINPVVDGNSLNSKSKTRQCAAFIEAKGRQCVRYANDGDIYCCIHLPSRFAGNTVKSKPARSVDNPMCGGTTTLGSRCKHRSLNGSAYCKKHGPHSDASPNLTTADTYLKRKHEDSISSAVKYSFSDVVSLAKPPHPEQDSVRDLRAPNGLQSTSGAAHPDTNPGSQIVHCVGSCSLDGSDRCTESPKRHSLYCDVHLPNWLKRARNGKSRIISKDVFLEILRSCSSLEQKKQLHRACELFYRFFKSVLSVRNPVPKEVQLQWVLTEASKDGYVRDYLMKLISSEKERLQTHWGFSSGGSSLSSLLDGKPSVERQSVIPSADIGYHVAREIIKCKICSAEFFDDLALGAHWMENHKKESVWLFRGYGCAICLDSFTNRKILESHIQEMHQKNSVEQYTLLQCILCDSHFGNSKDLWSHVLSCHPAHLKLSAVTQMDIIPSEKQPAKQPDLDISSSGKRSTENHGSVRRFICRFCGLKFNLLPDLGRHHQAAHMGQNVTNSHPSKAGIHYYALKLKAGRLKHPRFKKSLSSYQIRNRATTKMKHRIQTKLAITEQTDRQAEVQQVAHFERLGEPQCSEVAKLLFSEVQKSKPRPSNQEILSVARSTCCKENLQSFLEARYGVVPKKLYLKAAKLCSEYSIEIRWHGEGFVCPNGCKPTEERSMMSDLTPGSNELAVSDAITHQIVSASKDCEMDEGHYVIGQSYFSQRPSKKVICRDISYGQESVPIACIVDRDVMDLFSDLPDGSYCQKTGGPMPWENITYVTKPLVDQAVNGDPKVSQLKCDEGRVMCSSSTCDQVYLFNSDYEDARDIYGKPMHGRFPYDDQRCIILEEGYLVYECNHMCGCGKACPNRVLQNGVQVKLEVFKTKEKRWAVRAGQPILRGSFICEYVGEVLKEQEAIKRLSSYKEGCSYMYKIDPQANDIGRISGCQESFVIDATKYGNVSRFISHSSSSPNLMNYQVLVESTNCQLAHIGFYASRNIRMGEELTYNFQNGSLMGESCSCTASLCKGRSIR